MTFGLSSYWAPYLGSTWAIDRVVAGPLTGPSLGLASVLWADIGPPTRAVIGPMYRDNAGPVGWAVIPVDCCQDWVYDCVLSGPSFELLPDLLPDLTLAYDWARDCLIMGLLLGSKTGPLMFLAGTPSGHTGHRIGLSGPLSESH